MDETYFSKLIKCYPDFPKKGILFRDVMPLLENTEAFNLLIKNFSSTLICRDADAIVAVDARGFLFGSAIALELSKPLIVARKPGKLPGDLHSKKYDLEYGSNSLSIQKDAIKNYNKFAIIDDLLATGGTVNCVQEILSENKKVITGLCVVIELMELKGRIKFKQPIFSQVKY